MVAELCESTSRFQQAGGIASVLPKGTTSGRAVLPGPADDMSLFVYGNVEVKNLVTARTGPGIQFEVLHCHFLLQPSSAPVASVVFIMWHLQLRKLDHLYDCLSHIQV